MCVVGGQAAGPPCVAGRPRAGLPGEVGWAAVRYQPYGHVDDTGARDSLQYAGSCVNEDAEWLFAEASSSAEPREYLCPYPEYGRLADAATDAFGRYRCHGWDAFFLWAGPEETGESYDRPSLVWADASGELPRQRQHVAIDPPRPLRLDAMGNRGADPTRQPLDAAGRER